METTNLTDENKISIKPKIDIENQRFPFCLVWTPLPVISWLLPIIGHTGICEYINYK